MNQYTRYLTVLITAVQAYTIASGLESATGTNGMPVVLAAGYFFRFQAVVTLVGGTMFLVWLGEQITERGIGNGMSLLIFAGIVVGLPKGIENLYEKARDAAWGPLTPIAIIALVAGALGFGGVAGAAAGIAKVLFVLFLIICAIFLVLGVTVARKLGGR